MNLAKVGFGITICTLIAALFWNVGGAAMAALYAKIGSRGFYDIAGFLGYVFAGTVLYCGWLAMKEIGVDRSSGK